MAIPQGTSATRQTSGRPCAASSLFDSTTARGTERGAPHLGIDLHRADVEVNGRTVGKRRPYRLFPACREPTKAPRAGFLGYRREGRTAGQ